VGQASEEAVQEDGEATGYEKIERASAGEALGFALVIRCTRNV
jgi:hypothetical protein